MGNNQICACGNLLKDTTDLCKKCLQSLRKEEQDIIVSNFDIITEQASSIIDTTKKLWIGSGEDASFGLMA